MALWPNPTVYRLCDLCHQPMVGILRVSGDSTPRRIGECCDGVPITHPSEHPQLAELSPSNS